MHPSWNFCQEPTAKWIIAHSIFYCFFKIKIGDMKKIPWMITSLKLPKIRHYQTQNLFDGNFVWTNRYLSLKISLSLRWTVSVKVYGFHVTGLCLSILYIILRYDIFCYNLWALKTFNQKNTIRQKFWAVISLNPSITRFQYKNHI